MGTNLGWRTLLRSRRLAVLLTRSLYASNSACNQGMKVHRKSILNINNSFQNRHWQEVKWKAHICKVLLVSYQPSLTPVSNRFSKPGVKRRRSWDHVISGITFFFVRIQRCCSVPCNAGSCHWRNRVCAFAIPKFSVPGSLCVTKGISDKAVQCYLQRQLGSIPRLLTTKFWDGVKIVRQDELRVPVRMPYTYPHDATRKWLNASMNCKTESEPLVMLIHSKKIINASSPEALPPETPCLTLKNQMWFIKGKIWDDDPPTYDGMSTIMNDDD